MKFEGTTRLLGIDILERPRRVLMSAFEVGITPDQPPKLAKPIRMSNGVAFLGLAIMGVWALVEVGAGDRENLLWEIGFALAFAACIVANGLGWHRVGRLGALAVVDLTIFAGAVLFQRGSGGALPFIAMVSLPLLLFDRSELVPVAIGTVLAVALFTWCEAGSADALLHIQARPAPAWYYGANAASAFALSFLIPLFFFRASTRAEADLERSGKEKLQRLIDSSIIGVARGRLGGPILEANDALLRLLGFSRSDLEAGRLDLGALTPPEYAEITRLAIATLEESGTCPVFEKEYVRKDGTRVPVLVAMSKLDRRSSDAIGFMLDISNQKQLERQKEMVREKEEAVRLRDLFNSIASHELKTPLSALVLQVQRVGHSLDKGTHKHDDVMRQVRSCETSAKKLAVLVEELFDQARATQGKLDLSVRPMDLAEAARGIVGGLEASGACAAQQVTVHAGSAVSGSWDPVRIDQVITNLVSNAIKYGAGKPVDVLVTEGRSLPGEGDARLEVVDRGMGIDPSMLNKIFDPFQRAVSGKHIQGLGLGLFVVKSIVEAHGGTVRVETKRDAGSKFIVELPRHSCAT